MLKKLMKRIDSYKKEIIEKTRELVKIKSVKVSDINGMPFGSGIDRALNFCLETGTELGIKNKNIDGYAGQLEIGQGKEVMGILCHLDVVPAGNNWTYPPFGGEIHNNKIYGRGTIDNKGPVIASLYALKAIKEEAVNLNKRVRLILGTDEESGWEGLKYYLSKEKPPDFAFSPDASFPVIHAEKGFLIFKLKMDFNNNNQRNSNINIKSINGGNAPNMVPDSCQALLITDKPDNVKKKLHEFRDETSFKIKITDYKSSGSKLFLESEGISAHGSQPEAGQNAISQMLLFLSRLKLSEDKINNFISFYKGKIGMDYYGQSINCELNDKISGRLIFNVGMINLDRNSGELIVNIRYPVTYQKEKILKRINKALNKTEFVMEEIEHKKPLHIPKNDPLVNKLMSIYNKISKHKSTKPIAIGGGTYARALEKAVAFGPVFPGKPELAHQKDEYIDIDDLIQNTKIYTGAILELATNK